MSGLTMTDEDRAREVEAYVRELNQTEARLAGMEEGSKQHAEVAQTVDDIREQLRLRGHQAKAPHERAAKRMRTPEESR